MSNCCEKKCLDITKYCERMFPVCFPCSSTSLDCFHIIGFWIFVHCLASAMRELLKTAGVVWEWANQKAPCFVHNQSNTNTNTQIQKLIIQIHIQIQSSPSSAACKSNHRFSVSDRQPKKRSLIEDLNNQSCINFPQAASKSSNIISNYDSPVSFMPYLKPSPNVV